MRTGHFLDELAPRERDHEAVTTAAQADLTSPVREQREREVQRFQAAEELQRRLTRCASLPHGLRIAGAGAMTKEPFAAVAVTG